MQKIITLLSMLVLFSFSYAQDDSLSVMIRRGGGTVSKLATCPQWGSHPSSPANRILNPLFNYTVVPAPETAFEGTEISYWGNSHGTPQINVYGNTLTNFPTGINFASMWSNKGRAAVASEGIIGNLGGSNYNTHAVLANQQYVLSFYRSFTPEPTNPAAQLDKINIRLLRCEDAMQAVFNSYLIPPIPVNSQQIYCETNLNTTALERVVITFTANNDYDLIWIYPEQNSSAGQAWLQFAMPELTEMLVLANTSAGPSGLYLGLGPKFFNTSHKWYNQSNSLISTLTLNATAYDNYNTYPSPSLVPAGVNYGPIAQIPGNPQTYVLKVSFPNAAIVNNLCSSPFTGTLSSSSTPVVWRSAGQSAAATAPVGDLEIRAADRNRIWINSSFTEEGNSDIYVYDLTGKTITSLHNRQIRKGYNAYDLDVIIPGGIYIIKIISSKKVYAKKIFINDL